MKFLLLESTCDETAAAVVTDDLQVLASIVASQDEVHRPFQGVVPELAARAHLDHVLPVIESALQSASCELSDIDAIAVANTPGLAGSLLIGVTAAKTLAWVLDIPLLAVNHVHAHLYACRLFERRDVFPCVGLVVSGGHTSLFDCHSPCHFELLGGTIDDAAGEAFDKVAAMMGLPFPGGPAVARLAAQGDPAAYAFPRSFLRETDRLQFSFSGLKTAVRYAITGPGDRRDPQSIALSSEQKADLAASFQQAVVDCLVDKSCRAVARTGRDRLCVGGGVAANECLREALRVASQNQRFELCIAPTELCTDNAAMGAIAVERYRAGLFEQLDLDIGPGLVR
ncbi:MAG: tRNA (adenosine(37)-N6)-threonylcarbamoyltransferase complex transferase subunit TsaD [Planctomycetota bacterium]|nr:tRNA (adenosine(37)-N6)-threonylcarbamoyltransferase complex transferase subunit TsaD [Planctomycetota bacterium]